MASVLEAKQRDRIDGEHWNCVLGWRTVSEAVEFHFKNTAERVPFVRVVTTWRGALHRPLVHDENVLLYLSCMYVTPSPPPRSYSPVKLNSKPTSVERRQDVMLLPDAGDERGRIQHGTYMFYLSYQPR